MRLRMITVAAAIAIAGATMTTGAIAGHGGVGGGGYGFGGRSSTMGPAGFGHVSGGFRSGRFDRGVRFRRAFVFGVGPGWYGWDWPYITATATTAVRSSRHMAGFGSANQLAMIVLYRGSSEN